MQFLFKGPVGWFVSRGGSKQMKGDLLKGHHHFWEWVGGSLLSAEANQRCSAKAVSYYHTMGMTPSMQAKAAPCS